MQVVDISGKGNTLQWKTTRLTSTPTRCFSEVHSVSKGFYFESFLVMLNIQ